MRRTTVLLMGLMIVICFSISGVFALWQYTTAAALDVETNSHLKFMAWEGAEDLPDDDSTGDNHRKLIEMILNGTTTETTWWGEEREVQLGLNASGSYINKEVASRSQNNIASSRFLGSMDFWEASNINKYFNTSTDNISFVLYFPNGVSDTYYLFTTSVDLGGENAPTTPIGEYIEPIYRTVLKKNSSGVWEAVETSVGKAVSAWYDNRITGSAWLKYPSFEPDTWEETGT